MDCPKCGTKMVKDFDGLWICPDYWCDYKEMKVHG
jgi:uncharacterized Zn finger protein (UPF0148 family)